MGISGLKQRVAFVKEATYGTDPGSGYSSIGSIQGDPSISADNKLIDVHAGGRINTRNVLTGAYEVSAKLDWFVQDGAFLIMCLGDWDSTSPVTNGSNYQHLGATEDSTSTTAVPVEYEVNSFSLSLGLEQTSNDDVLKLTGCKANSLNLSLGMDEPLRANADIYAQKAEFETAVETFNEITYGPWMYHDKGTVLVDGVPVANLKSLSVDIAQGLQRENGILPATNKRCATAIHQGQRTVTGSITFNYDTYSNTSKFFSDAANATKQSDDDITEFDVSFLLDNNEITTAATYRGIYVQINDIKLGTLEKRLPQNGSVVEETYSFTAKTINASWYDATASDLW